MARSRPSSSSGPDGERLIGGPVADVLSARQVRALLGCTAGQLAAWRTEGLRAHRAGDGQTWWYRRDDLEQFLVARGER